MPDDTALVPPPFEIDIYQISDDALFKSHRTDGTGWDWSWATFRRDWMDTTPSKYAYRCLPLTMANQTGWWVRNPVGFWATWNGNRSANTIRFEFDTPGDDWKKTVTSQFGEGIITWTTPFLFRTKPIGSRLLIMGPANHFKQNLHPLTAVIESDWISMSFTMNWKIMTPNEPVRFDVGEPLFQAIPLAGNVCADLQNARVTYQRLFDDPAVHASYVKWSAERNKFHEQKAAGELKGDDWQKDYFKGQDATGREGSPSHMTKITPPEIHYKHANETNRPSKA